MAWRQKKEVDQAEWLGRVWPTPNSPPLRPHRPIEPERVAPTLPTAEGEGGPASFVGTGEGLAPLRNAVLKLRRGKLKAAAHPPSGPAQPARPPRPRQLTLLEWRRGPSGETPTPTVADKDRPWWMRVNWGLAFSLAAMAVTGYLILPDLVASARDGLGVITGDVDAVPALSRVEGEGLSAPAGAEDGAKGDEASGDGDAQAEAEVVEAAPEVKEAEAKAPEEAEPAEVAKAPEPEAPAAADRRDEPVPLLLAATHPDLALSARSALVKGKEELYAWNAEPARPVAGLTKLMAAMVYLDTQPRLDEVITLQTADAQLGGPSARLAPGWRYTARDLLTSILVGSENVGVEALVRSTGIGRDEFLIRMAEKAQLIGMSEAAFYDPTGLDPRNAASARDVARMLQEAQRYPLLRRETPRASASIVPVGRSTEVSFRNAMPLLGQDGWSLGVGKAGNTDDAGYCVATIATLPGVGEVAIVILGASSRASALRDVEQALEYLQRTRSSG